MVAVHLVPSRFLFSSHLLTVDASLGFSPLRGRDVIWCFVFGVLIATFVCFAVFPPRYPLLGVVSQSLGRLVHYLPWCLCYLAYLVGFPALRVCILTLICNGKCIKTKISPDLWKSRKIFDFGRWCKSRKCWEEFQINRNSCLSRKSCIPVFLNINN